MRTRAQQRLKLREAALAQRMLTTPEAAELTGYSRDHLGLITRKGVIAGSKRGRDWLIEAGSLLNYVMSDPRPGRKETD
jgi:Helix-turn-helix domain